MKLAIGKELKTHRQNLERGVAVDVLLVKSNYRLFGESGLSKLRNELVVTHFRLELLGNARGRHFTLVTISGKINSSLLVYFLCMECF